MNKTMIHLIALFTCCIMLCTQADALYIQKITSSSGYYSIKIHSQYPNNCYEVKGMPTSVPYLLTRINNFIKNNLKNDKTATIQFGYSDGQDDNHWFSTGSCNIQLPKEESIAVSIQSDTQCSAQTSPIPLQS